MEFKLAELGGSLSIIKTNGLITVIPEKTLLFQNFPNPFNPETWIPYQLASDGQVQITIYNVKGEMVKVLNLGIKQAGVYYSKQKAAYWNGKDEIGQSVASGIYFYTIQMEGFKATRRMLIVK